MWDETYIPASKSHLAEGSPKVRSDGWTRSRVVRLQPSPSELDDGFFTWVKARVQVKMNMDMNMDMDMPSD